MRKKQRFGKKMGAVLLTGMMLVSLLTGIPSRGVSQVEATTTLINPQTDSNGVVKWDCVYFGNYPQSGTTAKTKDPIKWRVLSVDGNDAFLVADKNLDVHEYHYDFVATTWETSTVRSWLNGYSKSNNNGNKDFTISNFIDTAFTTEEQNAILTTKVVNPDHPDPDMATDGGNDTEDKLFLLSYYEATNSVYGFSSDDTRIRTNTAYVAAGGSNGSKYTKGEGEPNIWWLRTSAGSSSKLAVYVSTAGKVLTEGFDVDSDKIGICPALHLDLSNTGVWFYAGTVSSDGSSEEVPYPSKYLKNINATKAKTSYETGDVLNVDDITVTAVYSDGEEKAVSNYTTNASDINMSIEGIKELIITYIEDNIEKTFVFEIEVTKRNVPEETRKTLESIKATKVKTSYETGDVLNVNDITVTAVYNDGTEQTVNSYMTNASSIDMLLEGNKQLVITYTEDGIEKTVSIEIEVARTNEPEEITKTLESIKVTKEKTFYEVGDVLNVDDITVTAVYSDGEEKVVTAYISNASDINMLSEGEKQLIITYAEDGVEKTAIVEIEITRGNLPEETRKTLESIKATKIKTSYETGDELNVDDIIVTAVYSNEDEHKVTTYITNVADIDMSVEGKKQLVITYREDDIVKTVVIEIEVKKRNVQDGTTDESDDEQQEEEDGEQEDDDSDEEICEVNLVRIKAEKEKVTYEEGEILTLDDLKVTAVYSDGDEVVVTDYTTNIADIDMTKAGTKDLIITYREDEIEQTAIVSIEIIERPTENKEEGLTEEKVYVRKITITGISKKIAAGKKVKLTAKVTPSNATNEKLIWASSNKKYATVNQNGQVTLKKKGAGKNVTITAKTTDGSGVKVTYTIRIMKHAVKKVAIKGKKTQVVKAGSSIKLKTTIKTTGKSVNKTLKWTSNNTKYATVSKSGKVKTKKAGKGKKVKITAMATDGSNKKATVTIKIK